MVHLLKMTPEEYAAYQKVSVADYAAEHLRAGDWAEEGALERAQKEFEHYLPQGAETPDHFLLSVEDDATGEKVGMIWFALRREKAKVSAFIYDFRIDENQRRKGYGRQTLEAAEAQARALGATAIGLHVFGHNHGAIALYQAVGYETKHMWMEKPLSG